MPLSKGAKKLKELLFEVFGQEIKIVEEYYLGESLRLDFLLPDYGLGFEFHGEQHRQFVEHFHVDAAGFRDSIRRDMRKIELCLEQDIALVIVWYDDELTKESIIKASKHALGSFEPIKTTESKPKESSERRQARLELARKARREQYQWAKEMKQGRQS